MPEELRKALNISWLVVSIAVYGVIGSALFLPANVWKALPPCEAKLAGGRCPVCGMTTAFYRAAAGDIAGATEANSASPYLLAAFSINSLASGAYIALKIKNKYKKFIFRKKGD